MGMNMLDVRFLQPCEYAACLGQVNHVDRQRTIGTAAYAKCQRKGAGESSGAKDRGPDRCCEKWQGPVLQDESSTFAFLQILLIHQFSIPPTHGYAQDLYTLVFEGPNLPSDEAAPDFWTTIDQVSDSEGRRRDHEALPLTGTRIEPQLHRTLKSPGLSGHLGESGDGMEHWLRRARHKRGT